MDAYGDVPRATHWANQPASTLLELPVAPVRTLRPATAVRPCPHAAAVLTHAAAGCHPEGQYNTATIWFSVRRVLLLVLLSYGSHFSVITEQSSLVSPLKGSIASCRKACSAGAGK